MTDMPARSLSKLAASGIALVSWPFFFIAEGTVLKKYYPQVFNSTARGITGEVIVGIEAVHPRDWTPEVLIAGLVLASGIQAIILAYIIYTKKNEKRSDA